MKSEIEGGTSIEKKICKVGYITSVVIPANNAQSKQIFAMATAFHRAGRCVLISPCAEETLQSEFTWIAASRPRRARALRMIEVLYSALRNASKFEFVFTRDIGIAFLLSFFFRKVCYEIHKPFVTRLGDWLFRLSLSRVSIVAISEGLQRLIVDTYKVPQTRILVAHDGADPDQFDAVRSSQSELRLEFGLPVERPIVLYSGSLYPGRGIELMQGAAKSLPDTMFIAVGGPPDQMSRWEETENFKLIAQRPHHEVPRLLKAADILFMPYTKATATYQVMSPLKLFEYMASGVPILASDIGTIPEVLNATNSYLFSPDQPEKIVQLVRHITQHPENASKIATQARLDLRNKYSWSIRVQSIRSFVETASACT